MDGQRRLPTSFSFFYGVIVCYFTYHSCIRKWDGVVKDTGSGSPLDDIVEGEKP